MLDKIEYVNDLEQSVTKQFAAIFPEEPQPQKFTFGLIQKGVLAEIARAVFARGIGYYRLVDGYILENKKLDLKKIKIKKSK